MHWISQGSVGDKILKPVLLNLTQTKKWGWGVRFTARMLRQFKETT